MAPLETTPFDAAEQLSSEDAIADFLSEAYADGDPEFIAHALLVVAKARARWNLPGGGLQS